MVKRDMDDLATIRLLRFALAAVWTALEDEPPENAQDIASSALALTKHYAPATPDPADDSRGLESWRNYLHRIATPDTPASRVARRVEQLGDFPNVGPAD